jgi:hypothetical protein
MNLLDWWFPARRGRPHEASHIELRDVDNERPHRGDHTADQDHPSRAELLFSVMEARGDLVWSLMGKDDEGRLTLGFVRSPPEELAVLVDDHDRLVGLRLSRSQAQEMHRAVVTWLADPTAAC